MAALKEVLHVGDQLIAIGNETVVNAKVVPHLLKHAPSLPPTLVLKRLPHAKLVTVSRSPDSDDLGFHRSVGTAEVNVNT